VKPKEEEYRQLFLAEAIENSEQLNQLLVDLEKNHQNKKAVTHIFRIIHTLKGNALGMGYESIADLTHVMEDIFGAIKENKITVDSELIGSLFRANDKLGALINSFNTGEQIPYLGIKTKLAVFLKNAIAERPQQESEESYREPKKILEKEPEIGSDQDKQEEAEDSSITFADVVQIPVRKMDELFNMVGELVIERDRLIAHFGSKGQSMLEFEGLKRISANLHYGIMNARMVQMGFLFNKFHRILRDVAVLEKKDVKLRLKGTEIEIDRNILKIISDSLVHLVRNAVSHGIERAEERGKLKKSPTATVTLEANLERDNVVLSVSDDGRGIDINKIKEKAIAKKMITRSVADRLSKREITRYIFEPGFSSAEIVTEISGRGVGMDVVKKSVEDIGGQVLIDTAIGEGTSFHLVLPSSLALKGSLLFEVNSQEYAIPLTYIDSVNYYKKEDVHHISNGLMVNYNDQSVALIFLEYLFKVKDIESLTGLRSFNEKLKNLKTEEQINVIMAKHSGRRIGLVVDKLLRQKEIIEKKLPKPLNSSKLLSGSTILGSGNVCPVVDVAAIMDFFYKSSVKAQAVSSF